MELSEEDRKKLADELIKMEVTPADLAGGWNSGRNMPLPGA